MKYQLVIQFPENLVGGLERLIQLEDILEENLQSAEIDGHDCGNGEMNIFIFTDEPMISFNEIKNLFTIDSSIIEKMKIAYRDIEKEEFICIWPEGMSTFKIV